jgi:regulator of replication initiation timing
MKDEIKEILEFKENADYKRLSVDEIVTLEDYITNLQQENEELKLENEKLTQLWLSSQEKRRKAIKYLKQPYRDNFDYSKSELMEILGDEE